MYISVIVALIFNNFWSLLWLVANNDVHYRLFKSCTLIVFYWGTAEKIIGVDQLKVRLLIHR